MSPLTRQQPIRSIVIAGLDGPCLMYLDIHENMDTGGFHCGFEMPVCPGVDKIQIHAIITSDATELANKR
jgi:hypothetical protein